MNSEKFDLTDMQRDIDAGVAEAGVYPLNDGTRLVVLRTAINRDDNVIKSLRVVREPTAKEEDDAGGQGALVQYLSNAAFAKIVPRVTDPQITGNVFMQLGAADRLNIKTAILSFLPN